MQIKICGVTEPAVAQTLSTLGVDLMGLICVPTSPRYVSVAKAKELTTQCGPTIKTVLVFQNQSLAEIQKYMAAIKPAYIQLHGQEPSEFCQALKYPVIKTIRLQKTFRLTTTMIKDYATVASYLLIDRSAQGVGPLVDLVQVKSLSQKYPIILAGGLTPTNITPVLDQVGNSLAGVDVSSGVEFLPGKKDLKKIKQFITTVRSYHVSH